MYKIYEQISISARNIYTFLTQIENQRKIEQSKDAMEKKTI